MLNSEIIKKKAREFGADLVGIGDISLFAGTIPQRDPLRILPKAKCIIGFGFAVLAFVLAGGGLWIGITVSDSLQTAENIYESLHLLWLYPALAVILSLIFAFLPAGSWKLMVLLEVALLAGAAIYAIVGATAAARMTELDKKGR